MHTISLGTSIKDIGYHNDFKMGGTHVMMRVKLIHMFLDFFEGMSDVPVTYPVRDALVKEHYHIVLNNETVKERCSL